MRPAVHIGLTRAVQVVVLASPEQGPLLPCSLIAGLSLAEWTRLYMKEKERERK
jgi:hypothetical protein